MSQFLRHSAQVRSYDFFCRADSATRTRLLSASGPTAGSSFVAPLSTAGVHYSDLQWAGAVGWRLGIPAPGPAVTCLNERRNGQPCNEHLDATGDHAVECGIGPLRTFRHDNLADAWADIFEETGALARREVFVQELSDTQEAWLDVWGYGISELPDALLDITVRHPKADRYQPGAASFWGHAAAKAEQEKHEKYPARMGRSVWAIAHETWGRLGYDAEQLLVTCSAAASRRSYRRGRVPGNCLRRWRAQLDAILHRGIVAQLDAARFGLPGRSKHRKAPVDCSALEANSALSGGQF